MSSVDFAIEGASSESFEEMDFFRKDPAEVSLLENGSSYSQSCYQISKDLKDRIDESVQDDRTLYIIDNVVQVLDLSRESRHNNIQFWESRRIEMFYLGGLGCLGSVGSIGLAAMGAPILGSASAVFAIFTAVVGFVRASQASTQMDNWKAPDLSVEIAMQRKEVFERGFLTALLEGKCQPYVAILNTSELQGLYYAYFQKFVEELTDVVTDQDKVRLIKESMNRGPLKLELLKSAQLSERQFQVLERQVQDYNQVMKGIQFIIGATYQEKKEMKDFIEACINEIEREKEEALLPLKQRFALKKERLHQQYLQAKRNIPSNATPSEALEYNRRLEEEYHYLLQEAEIEYNQITNIILRPFNERIAKERQALDLCLKNIEHYQDDQLLPYFNPLARIQIYAFHELSNVSSPLSQMKDRTYSEGDLSSQ